MEALKAIIKNFVIATQLKLFGFRAWVAGIIFNKIWKIVEVQVVDIYQKVKDKVLTKKLEEELKKPNQDKEQIIKDGKNVLEG